MNYPNCLSKKNKKRVERESIWGKEKNKKVVHVARGAVKPPPFSSGSRKSAGREPRMRCKKTGEHGKNNVGSPGSAGGKIGYSQGGQHSNTPVKREKEQSNQGVVLSGRDTRGPRGVREK